MTKLYDKDMLLDKIEDYIDSSLDQIIEDNLERVIELLQRKGYDICLKQL